MHFNLRHLATFVAVYQAGSFSAAAMRLNATQSGLSMHNHNLEEALGVKLFERTQRGVRPTVAGRELYPLALRVLESFDRIGPSMSALRDGISGEIKIGLMPTFTRGLLPKTVATFLEQFPNVKVVVSEAYTTELADMVASGDLDCAIVPAGGQPETLKTTWFATDREVLVTAPNHQLPHLQPVRLTELPPLKYVLPRPGNARRDALDRYWQMHGLERQALFELDGMLGTLAMVAGSDYVTILPETICMEDIDGKSRWLHPVLDNIFITYVTVERTGTALSVAAKLFLDALKRQYDQRKAEWEQLIAHHSDIR